MKRDHLAEPSPFESGIWGTAENPCPSERTLAAHIDGQLEFGRAEVVEQHLDACSTCARAARRIEGLSNLLRTWDLRGTGHSPRRVEVPQRLSAAVLRTVAPEAAALRRETLRASARALGLAAAVLVALSAGIVSGWTAPAAEWATGPASGTLGPPGTRGARVTADAVVAPALSFDAGPSTGASIFDVAPGSDIPSGDPSARVVRGADSADSGAAGRRVADVLAPFFDDEIKRVFARYVPHVETERSIGEICYIVDDRALPLEVAAAYGRVRRKEAYYAELARSAAEPVTVDPSAKGLSVNDVLPLPAAGELARFLQRLPTFVEPASRHAGGVVVRALPGRKGSAEAAGDVRERDGAPKARGALADGDLENGAQADAASADGARADGATEPDSDVAIDLEAAVAARTVVLRADAHGAVVGSATSVTLDVAATTTSILVPAGELLTGAGGDRVVTEGIWLPPSRTRRTIVLACLPVSRSSSSSVSASPVAASTGMVVPTGLVAGPELRGLLAYRADRDGVFALVDAQIADAALDRGVDGKTSLLALYDRASPEVAVARALAHDFAVRFPFGTAGFVVSDPDGRFQGIEYTTFRGASRRAVLERLLVGYLVESRTRTSLDAPRAGLAVEVALARLVEGAPRLATKPSSLRPGGFATGSRTGTGVDGASREANGLPAAPRRLSGQEPRSGVRIEGVPTDTAKPPLVSGLIPGIR